MNDCSKVEVATSASTEAGSEPSADPKLPLDFQMEPSNSSRDVSRQ